MAQKKTVYGLELDAKKLIDSLKDVAQQVNAFQSLFSKPITLKIDAGQLTQLLGQSTKLGQSLRGALSVQTDTLVASLDEVRDAITKIATASGQAGKAIADGLTEGGAKGAQAIISSTRAAEDALDKLSARQKDQLENIQARFAYRANQLPAASQAGLSSRLNELDLDYNNPLTLLKTSGQSTFISSAQQGAIDRVFQDFEQSVRDDANTLRTLTAQRERSLAAEKQQILAVEQDAAAEKKRASALSALDQQFRSASNRRDAGIESQLNSQFRAAMNARDRSFASEQSPSPSQQDVSLLDQIAARHQAIGLSIADSAINLGKWLVFYRLVRDTMREIESLFSSFVSAGVQYTKQLDEEQRQLAGVLNANFDVRDAQGNILTGAAKIVAIQTEAARQTKLLQDNTKGVAATTKDLADIYVEIAEPISRAGGDTQKLQQVTTLAAAAANALGISYKDMGTEISHLLGGTGQDSKLATAIGITPDQVRYLRDTPEALDLIIKKLQAFSAFGKDETFGGVVQKFQQIVSVLSANIEAPILDVFKSLVQYLTNLKDTPQFQFFLSQLQTAMRDVAGSLRDFGREVSSGGVSTLGPLALGFRDLAQGAISLFETLVNGTKTVVTFIGQNQTLLKWIGDLTVALVGLNALDRVGSSVIQLLKNFGLLGPLVNSVTSLMRAFGVALGVANSSTSTAGQQIGFVSQSVSGFKGALEGIVPVIASVGTALLTGALALGIGFLISRLAALKQSADDARASQARLALGDVDGGVLARSTQLNSSDVVERGQASRVFGSAADTLRNSMASQSVTLKEAVDNARAYREEQQKIYDQISSNRSLTAEQVEQLRQTAENYGLQAHALDDLVAKGQNFHTYASTLGENIKALSSSIDDLKAKDRSLEGQTQDESGGVATQRAYLTQEIDKRTALLKDLLADYYKVKALADEADRANERQNAPSVTLTPSPKEPRTRPFTSFSSEAGDQIKTVEDKYNQYQQTIKKMYDADLLSDEQYADRSVDIEHDRQLEVSALYDKERQDLADWIAKEQKGKEEETAKLDVINAAQQKSLQDSNAKIDNVNDERLKNQRAHAASIAEINEQMKAELDRIYGDTADRTGDLLARKADQFEQALIQAKVPVEQAKEMVAQLRSAIPDAVQSAGGAAGAKSAESSLQSVRQQQDLLDKQLATGTVSVKTYVEQTQALQERQKQLISQEITDVQQQLDVLTKVPQVLRTPEQQAQIDALIAKLGDLGVQLQSVTGFAAQLQKTFTDFTSVAGDLSKFFAGFGQSGQFSQIADVFGRIRTSVSGAVGLGRDLPKLVADFDQLKKVITSSGGLGSALSGLTGGAALTGLSSIAGAVLAVASYTYQQAVQDAEQTMVNSIQAVTNALQSGRSLLQEQQVQASESFNGFPQFAQKEKDAAAAVAASTNAVTGEVETLGQAISTLQQQRQDFVNKYSSQKGGADALNKVIPQLDQEIAQLQAQSNQIRKSFEDQLAQLQGGTGPFGDFYRQLLDLQTKSKEYLDTFTQGTDDYREALQNITQMFNLTLEGAKSQLEQELSGFQSEAAGAVQTYISALDQQQSLYQQLSDNEQSRKDLQDQIAQTTEDEAKQWQQIQQDRVAHTEKILDLEKQISDVITQAAQDEADIRRQGVVEAQETIAQQKARQIAAVRNDAASKVADLQKQLNDENSTYNYQQQVDDYNRQVAKEQEDLQRQSQQLDLQNTQLQQQIKINAIQVEYEKEIADIEGGQFGLSQDRYALETQIGQIQIAQAREKVSQWGQVQALIDSIVQSGDSVIFNPPPGFPQIRVQIGNITIDNRDQSANTITYPSTPIVRGPNPSSPIDVGNGPPPADTVYPYDFIRKGYGDLV